MVQPIKQDVRDKWADALDSGAYPQAAGSLRYDDDDEEGSRGFCCLGVLCQVAIAEGLDGFRWNENRNVYEVEEEPGEWRSAGTGSLHPLVITWAGLDPTMTGDVRLVFEDQEDIGGDSTSAIHANDDLGKTFAEIAAAVRALPVTQ